MKLYTNNFVLKSVCIKDAKFILKLRMNENLNKYLSQTGASLEGQKQWLRNYKLRQKQGLEYYFKVCDKSDNDIGFIRLYNVDNKNKVCTFGSFILKEDRPKLAAIESMVCIIKFAFYDLKMNKVVLDVRVKNEHAKKLYKRFGFQKIDENDLDEFYELTSDKFKKMYNDEYYKFMEVKNES